jgi:hypothetical protein
MSAEPPSSSGLPNRSRPVLSDLSKETTEGDLWNLDDDEPAAPKHQPTPPPEGPKPRGGQRETPGITTPPVSRGKPPAEPVHPLAPRGERPVVPDEIGDLDELDEPAEEEVVVMIVPDDAVEDLPAPVKTTAPAAKTGPAQTPAPEPEIPAVPENKPRPAAPPASRPAPTRPRMNRREALGLALFAFVLLVAAIWVITRFFGQIPMKSEFVEGPDFPVKGEHASLANAETFWRVPLRDGASRDVARREVVMIPVLEIELDPEGSPSGALRVVFRNGQGEPVGDSITRSFSAGRFDASGNAKAAFPATDGFLDQGTFNAYRTGKGDPWTAEVLEGPSVDAPASSFKKLAPIPVLPLRR